MKQQDDTEKLRQQLQKQAKLAEIGTLTAGILHEIRNPLNFVTNFSNLSLELVQELFEIIEETALLDNDFKADITETAELIKANIEKIKRNAERVNRIIASMLASTHENGHKFETTNLGTLVQEAVKLAYQGLRGNNSAFNATIDFEIQANLPAANIVPQDISRCIINIAGNAFYALSQKKEPNFFPQLFISVNKINQNFVIKIKDNGTGIDKETQSKIFQPFFTTKLPTHGTGLGLSLSHQIITEIHKGKLDVSSEIGKFTEFIILIPDNLRNENG